MTYLHKIRPVLFLFYMVESVLNLILINYILKAFAYIQQVEDELIQDFWYIFHLIFTYLFTVLTLFASVNLCTKNQPSILEEFLRPLVGAIVYTLLTLFALYDAEADVYVMFPQTQENTDYLQSEKPLHPHFKLLRSQASSSLVCSVIYLLHSLIALDVLLSNEDSNTGREASDDSLDLMEVVEQEYLPVQLFVLGSHVQRWLERYQWFRDYIHVGAQEL